MNEDAVRKLAQKLGRESFGYLVPACRFWGLSALVPIKEYLFSCVLLVELELEKNLFENLDELKAEYETWRDKFKDGFIKVLAARTDLGPKRS